MNNWRNGEEKRRNACTRKRKDFRFGFSYSSFFSFDRLADKKNTFSFTIWVYECANLCTSTINTYGLMDDEANTEKIRSWRQTNAQENANILLVYIHLLTFYMNNSVWIWIKSALPHLARQRSQNGKKTCRKRRQIQITRRKTKSKASTRKYFKWCLCELMCWCVCWSWELGKSNALAHRQTRHAQHTRTLCQTA